MKFFNAMLLFVIFFVLSSDVLAQQYITNPSFFQPKSVDFAMKKQQANVFPKAFFATPQLGKRSLFAVENNGGDCGPSSPGSSSGTSGACGGGIYLGWLMFGLAPTAALDLTSLIGNIVAMSIGRGQLGWGIAGVVMSSLSLTISTAFFTASQVSHGFEPEALFMFAPSMLVSMISIGLGIKNILAGKKLALGKLGKLSDLRLSPFVDRSRASGELSSGLLLSGRF